MYLKCDNTMTDQNTFYLGYIDELLNLVFNKVIAQPAPFLEELMAMSVPEPLCSQYERPERADVLTSYVSRFSHQSREGLNPTDPLHRDTLFGF